MCRGDQSSPKVKLLILCLGIGYALAVVMAVCPELHQWVHHDSGGHECMVTAMAHGQVDSVVPVSVVVAYAPVEMGAADFSWPGQELPVFCAGFVLEHAPPVA